MVYIFLVWLFEAHDTKKFIAVKVHTTKNLADGLTKPLNGTTRKALELELKRKQSRILGAL